MAIKAAEVIPALHATKTTVQEQASVMVGQEWRRESLRVVRLMSTDLVAFTMLWGVNNGCHIFFLVIFTFAVSSFLFVS